MTDEKQIGIYEIRIKGHLSNAWSEKFEQMQLTLTDDGDSILTGAIIDQSALHATLRTIRDMGLELISINQINDTEKQ